MNPVEYGLGRGYASSARLNFVHFLWKETVGYLLPPTITAKSDTRVADIGTGTGIWLFDVADNLPESAVLDGFDISGEQYSPKEWIPRNVSLHIWNALEEPPSKYLEQYDIVHLRLFMIIVQNYDPKPLLNNCKKLLKPGGHLILEEIDLSSSMVMKISPSNTTTLLEKEENILKEHKGIRWIGSLPQILGEMEFCDIQVQRVSQLGWKTKMWQQQQLLVREEYINNFLTARDGPEKAELHRQQIREMWAEVQQGSALGVCLQNVVAQRPTTGEAMRYSKTPG